MVSAVKEIAVGETTVMETTVVSSEVVRMDVHERLDAVIAMVEQARSMPMSASCMLNRAELLAALDEVRELVPTQVAEADAVLAERDALLAAGREERDAVLTAAREQRDRILAQAMEERERLVGESEVLQTAQAEAERLLAEAAAEAERRRRETDEFVDGRLATFEVVLTKTLATVERGRDRLGLSAHAPQMTDDTGM